MCKVNTIKLITILVVKVSKIMSNYCLLLYLDIIQMGGFVLIHVVPNI